MGKEEKKFILALTGALIGAWVIWVSSGRVSGDTRLALLEFKVFGEGARFSQLTPTRQGRPQSAPSLLAEPSLFPVPVIFRWLGIKTKESQSETKKTENEK